ncbi:VNX1 (YNL321W) [Zygosaccharomyces parabailii]|nr:VNX1 (YNL321W) [Zygosaccharomyces parabailii]CDH09492.1 related to Member of Ca++/H+ Antiporter family [Zygosaccharomyces bailii ISA1307]
MGGSKDRGLHALHSNGTVASGQDHVYRVFSVDDDPDEIEHDIKYLEGLHDGLKYALNGKASKSGAAQNILPSSTDTSSSPKVGGSSKSKQEHQKQRGRQGQHGRQERRQEREPVQEQGQEEERQDEQSHDQEHGNNGERQPSQVKIMAPAHAPGDDKDDEDSSESQVNPHEFLIEDMDNDSGSHRGLLIGEPGGEDEENGSGSDQASMADSLESYTLRERQHAINETHPFGIRIWKPALYKKHRSVQKVADEDIHETHLKSITWWVRIPNIIWSLSCGLFLFLVTSLVSLVVLVLGCFTESAREYSVLLLRLAYYLLWPFGKVVYLTFDEQYSQEDKDEGISAQQFYNWVTSYSNRLFFHRSQTQDTTPLLGDSYGNHQQLQQQQQQQLQHQHKPSYGSTDSNRGRHSQQGSTGSGRSPNSYGQEDESNSPSSKTAIQRRYFGRGKWTLGRFVFYLCFHLVLQPIIFVLAFLTWLFVFTIPMSNILWNLTYHIRRHPLALGFKSVKSQTKPGETISSINDSKSILLCTFRCAGWYYYKFTVDGTNVIVMNLVTLVFFTIFDFYVLKRVLGPSTWISHDTTIFALCLASIVPLAFYIGQAVASISAQTSMGLGAVINAFFSTVVEIFLYCVALRQSKGLMVEGSMIGSILGAVLLLPGLSMCGGAFKRKTQRYNPKSASVSSTMLIFSMIVMFVPTLLYEIYGGYVVKCDDDKRYDLSVTSIAKALSSQRCSFSHPALKFNKMYTHVIEPMSVSCAVVLALAYLIGLWFTLRTHAVMIWHFPISDQNKEGSRILEPSQSASGESTTNAGQENHGDEDGGHESPNWSRGKSTFILLFATVLYAVIAEVLVSCVDGVLEASSLNPKFLGLTILALVPNTTEFLNAISFAIHGNVALSMEIGSAYALQVCLLQIPTLVIFSIWYTWNMDHYMIDIRDQMFALVFPKWDLVASVASVFMFTYLYAEGKSNYFKGSVLILLYVIVIFGFYFQGLVDNWDSIEVNH